MIGRRKATFVLEYGDSRQTYQLSPGDSCVLTIEHNFDEETLGVAMTARLRARLRWES